MPDADRLGDIRCEGLFRRAETLVGFRYAENCRRRRPHPRSGRRTPPGRNARRVAARPGARRGRGISRSRQRREQHDRRRSLRLSPGLGRRAGQRDGLAHPVPLCEARHRHRPEPSRNAGRTHSASVGSPGVLAASRTRGDGDRHRRGHRRSRRPVAPLRGSAAVGRGDHRVGLDRAAADPDAARRAHFEFVVIGLLAIIALGFTYGVFLGPPDPAAVVAGLVPRFDGADSVLLAASILGATIMPHAIYAHSALARDRFAPAKLAPLADHRRPARIPTPAPTPTPAGFLPARRTSSRSTPRSSSCAASRPVASSAPRAGMSASP